MANEFTISVSLSCFKSSIMSEALGIAVDGLIDSMTGTYISRGVALIATSATAIPLGQVTAPHWAILKNLDSSNFIKIRNGSGGTDLLKIRAGKANLISFLDSATPYAIADTASCLLEYLIFTL